MSSHQCDPKPATLFGMSKGYQCGCGRYFCDESVLTACSCGCGEPVLVGNSFKGFDDKWYKGGHYSHVSKSSS